MNKNLAVALIIVGVLIVVAVLLAAPLHLASAGFGTHKILGLVVGIVVLLAGLIGTFSGRSTKTG